MMNLRKMMAELGNPHREFRYSVVLPFDFNGKVASRVIDIRSSPFEMDYKQVRMKNRDYYFAIGKKIGDVSLTLLEDESHASLDWLEGWQLKMVNKDETVNPPFSYIAPIVKIEEGYDGRVLTKKHYLCFPYKSSDQFSKWEPAGDSKVKLNINFKVVQYWRD